MLELQPLPLHLPETTEVYAWCETLKAGPKEIPEWQVFHQNHGGQKEVALHFASVFFFFKTSTRILFIQGRSLYFQTKEKQKNLSPKVCPERMAFSRKHAKEEILK